MGDNIRFLQEGFAELNRLLGQYGELAQAARNGGGDLRGKLEEVEEALKKVDLPYLSTEIPRAIEQTLERVEPVAKIVRGMKGFSHPGTKEKTLADLKKAGENTPTGQGFSTVLAVHAADFPDGREKIQTGRKKKSPWMKNSCPA